MSEERFIEIEHKLDKADDDLTRTSSDVVALQKEVAALKAALAEEKDSIRRFLADHGELIGLALSVCADMNVVQMQPDRNEAYHQFVTLFRKYSPRFTPQPYRRIKQS